MERFARNQAGVLAWFRAPFHRRTWGCLLKALLTAGVLASGSLGGSGAPSRTSIPLNGEWRFRQDIAPATEWKPVNVPSSFQSHEGTNFHGVGWYRKEVAPPAVEEGKRVLLQFHGAATEAEVWLNDQRLGKHLGGWTPFRFDVTDILRKVESGRMCEIRVRLEEKVGHNTQGFLPIIAPHFGGLWQGVEWLVVPNSYFDDLKTMAVGDLGTRELRVELPLAGDPLPRATNVTIRARLLGQDRWEGLKPESIKLVKGLLHVRVPFPEARAWSPGEPNVYQVEVALPGADGDAVSCRAAFRRIEAFGSQIRLNGQAIQIRGVLNWGYCAPANEPNAGEAFWRSELAFARNSGFNLMKFCLWIPPRRYLELADELGVLTWMEYPTWHPNLTQKYLEPLEQEFAEFFYYDRNYPSVVLRSLTCETGPSAELQVIQRLYDTAHRMIPDALIEDDSSWIEWNRIHDFYDDHPYGNNHDWVSRLTGFKKHILANGLKPLVLGECMAADTWIDRPSVISVLGTNRPWWAPGPLDEMVRWQDKLARIAGPDGLTELKEESLRYGMLMRKFQIEAYRREVPDGGYVVSVIRDIATASMGLIDYAGQSKWSPSNWSFQGDTMCLLKTDADRRSFASGETLRGSILLSHYGIEPLDHASLTVAMKAAAEPASQLASVQKDDFRQNPATLAELAELEWPLPQVSSPTRVLIKAELRSPKVSARNEWPVWVVPKPGRKVDRSIRIHESLAGDLARELFPGALGWTNGEPARIVVASKFDDALANYIEGGGRVLFLPNGQAGSLARSAHWFLRGAPYIPGHPLTRIIPRDFLVELQHFDLADDVVPAVPQLESMNPILMLWDTHDLRAVKTHGIVFETRIGKGRLLVSAARHRGEGNAAGRWLLGTLVDHLSEGPEASRALPTEVWGYLKDKLQSEQTNLVTRTWKFKADPKAEGLAKSWYSPELTSEREWKNIQIGAWWESQGYADLDGWAWYRLWVDVPETWRGKRVYLSFMGVDDMYECFVNGKPAGSSGDIATRKDALSEKKSYDVTSLVKPGEKALVAVRVYDWYGAGGIFRPVYLGTLPFNPDLDFLQ
jgi:hypothetical protein